MIVNNIKNTNQVTQTTSNKKNTKTGNTSFEKCLNSVTVNSKDTTEVTLDDIFEKAAKKYNVPVNLLKAIGYTESTFNPKATSSCGAQGIMQLMPATAKSLGVTDAYDPEQNIMGGAKYIAGLLDKYNGNTSLALAAYNAGSGNVAKYGGIPPFKETQNYVVKVTNYMNQNLDGSKLVAVNTKSHGVSSKNIDTTYKPVFLDDDDTENVQTLQDKMDEMFSYDTYELFLKLFQEDDETKDSKKGQDTSLSQMNMNPTIANLLKSVNV